MATALSCGFHRRRRHLGSRAVERKQARVAEITATSEKFSFHATALKEFEHWLALVRSVQATLVSLVLASKRKAIAHSALPGESIHGSPAEATSAIERALEDHEPELANSVLKERVADVALAFTSTQNRNNMG